jgi:hypothetical protein
VRTGSPRNLQHSIRDTTPLGRTRSQSAQIQICPNVTVPSALSAVRTRYWLVPSTRFATRALPEPIVPPPASVATVFVSLTAPNAASVPGASCSTFHATSAWHSGDADETGVSARWPDVLLMMETAPCVADETESWTVTESPAFMLTFTAFDAAGSHSYHAGGAA